MPAATSRKNNVRGALFNYPLNFDPRSSTSSKQYLNKSVFDFDLRTGTVRTVDTDVAGHVVEANPTDINISAVSSRRSDALALIDWKKERQIAFHQFEGSQRCYGHSAFSENGRELLVPAYSSEDPYLGMLYRFEVPTLKLIEKINLKRGSAHELLSIGDGKYLFGALSDDTNPAAFGIYNDQTKETAYYPSEFIKAGARYQIGHLKRFGNKVIGGLNRVTKAGKLEGALVAIDLANSSVKTEIPLGQFNLLTELLSLEFDPVSEFIWVTVPFSKAVVIWNWKSHQVVKVLAFPKDPTFVSAIPDREIVIIGTENQLFAYDSKSGSRMEGVDSKWPNKFLKGRYCAHSRLI